MSTYSTVGGTRWRARPARGACQKQRIRTVYCMRALLLSALLSMGLVLSGCAGAPDDKWAQTMASQEARGVEIATTALAYLPEGQPATQATWQSLLAMQYTVGYLQAGLSQDTPHALADTENLPETTTEKWEKDLRYEERTIELAISALIVHHQNTLALLDQAQEAQYSELAQDLATSRQALIVQLQQALIAHELDVDPQAVMSQYAATNRYWWDVIEPPQTR